jgi:hypothetical protein
VEKGDEQAQAHALAAVEDALRMAQGSLAKVLEADAHLRLDEILRAPLPQPSEFQHDLRLLRALDRLTEAQREALGFALRLRDPQREVLERALRVLAASDAPPGD